MSTDAPSPAPPVDDVFETRKQVARRHLLSESFIKKMTDEGVIPHYRFGRAVRYRRSEVDAFVESHRHAGEPASA